MEDPLPIKLGIKNFKTLHENKQDLEQFYSAEKLKQKEHLNRIIALQESVIKSYEKTEDKAILKINSLDRFTPLSNSEMLEDIEGEYVLFSSVLNLFSAQNKNK